MRKALLSLILVAIFGGLGYLAFQGVRADPDGAEAGDCVRRSGNQDVRVVDCVDPASEFKVLGRVANKTRIEAQISSGTVCKDFPEAQASFWRGEEGKPGYVLCLGAVR